MAKFITITGIIGAVALVVFFLGGCGPAQAQMMGSMQTHTAMQVGMQKVIDGSILMENIFKMVDDKSLDIVRAEPFLRQSNKLIQEGKDDIIKAQQQMKTQMKTKMETKKPEGAKEPTKRRLKMQEMKSHDHKTMKDETKPKEEPSK